MKVQSIVSRILIITLLDYCKKTRSQLHHNAYIHRKTNADMKTSNKLNIGHRIAKLYTYLTNDELKSDSVQIIRVRSRFRQKDQRRISVLERYHLTRYHDLCDVQVVIRPPIFLGGVGEVRNIAISFFCICVHAVYVSCQLSSILPENIIYSMWTPKIVH